MFQEGKATPSRVVKHSHAASSPMKTAARKGRTAPTDMSGGMWIRKAGAGAVDQPSTCAVPGRCFTTKVKKEKEMPEPGNNAGRNSV